MHAPILVTTTHPGLPSPPYSIGTPPTHLLALCHPHPPSSPHSSITLGNSKCQFVCAHTHAHLIWANNPPAPSTSPFTHGWGAIKNPVHLGVTSLFSSLLTFVDISVHHGWGAVKNPVHLGVTSLFSSLLTFVNISGHHSWGAILNPKCPPYLSRAQPLFSSLSIFISILFTLLGPMLLTLHAHPIHQFPVDHYWQNSSSMAGELLKTHTMLPIG